MGVAQPRMQGGVSQRRAKVPLQKLGGCASPWHSPPLAAGRARGPSGSLLPRVLPASPENRPPHFPAQPRPGLSLWPFLPPSCRASFVSAEPIEHMTAYLYFSQFRLSLQFTALPASAEFRLSGVHSRDSEPQPAPVHGRSTRIRPLLRLLLPQRTCWLQTGCPSRFCLCKA